jgi:hypothetical protein
MQRTKTEQELMFHNRLVKDVQRSTSFTPRNVPQSTNLMQKDTANPLKKVLEEILERQKRM